VYYNETPRSKLRGIRRKRRLSATQQAAGNRTLQGIECPQLGNENADDSLAQIVATHQYADWRAWRHKSKISREVKEKIANLARQIRDALNLE
jgi:hypothetical protein